MGIRKAVLGALFELEPTAAPASKAPVTPVVPVTPVAPVASVVIAGAISQDMLNDLMQAISDANLEGYDYLELMDAVKNMSSLPFTEEQKIMAAFATVSNQTSFEKIMASIAHYVSVIDKRETEFMDTAAKKEQAMVGGREDQIKAIDVDIAAAAQQITDLTAKINELQTNKGTLSGEKEEHRIKIESKRASFKITAQTMRDKSLADKAKIERAITPAAPKGV
jgi:hypothetical protein